MEAQTTPPEPVEAKAKPKKSSSRTYMVLGRIGGRGEPWREVGEVEASSMDGAIKKAMAPELDYTAWVAIANWRPVIVKTEQVERTKFAPES